MKCENNVHNNQWMMEQKNMYYIMYVKSGFKKEKKRKKSSIICTLQDNKDNLWTRKTCEIKNAYNPSK